MREILKSALNKSDNATITNTEIESLTYLDCSNATARFSKTLENITGLVSTFTNLQRLNLSKNEKLNSPDLLTGAIYKLVSLDVSECAELKTLNLMTSVSDGNADNNLKLQYLNCSATPLEALNLAKCTDLVSLDCSNTKLSTISLTNNTKLRSLKLDNMGYGGTGYTTGTSAPTLKTLDVTPCTELRELSLSWGMTTGTSNNRNPLSLLDVSRCTKLETLNCKGSKLTALDLSNNAALKTLDCSYNSLTALDVSQCSKLETLDCGVMSTLTTLTFGNNPELYFVSCKNTGLTELDITTCPKLTVDKDNDNAGVTCDGTVTVTSGPKFHSQALILRGNLGMEFNIEWRSEEMTNTNYFDKNTSMSFDINGTASNIVDGQYVKRSGDLLPYECQVNSVQIADNIKAYFSYTKQNVEGTEDAGVTKTITRDYTVQKYLDALEEASGPWYSTSMKEWYGPRDKELYELVKAIKDFGHYVQPVLAKNNGWAIGTKHALIEAGNVYSDDYVAQAANAVKAYAMTSNDQSSGLTASYTLQLDSMTKLIVYLESSDAVTSISAKLDEGTAEMAIQYATGKYYVEIDDISPHMLSKDHTISVTTTTTTGTGTLTLNISALSYADAILNPKSGTTPDLGHGITADEAKKAAASIYYYCHYTREYRAKKGYTD